jgi:hypothetical protein
MATYLGIVHSLPLKIEGDHERAATSKNLGILINGFLLQVLFFILKPCFLFLVLNGGGVTENVL